MDLTLEDWAAVATIVSAVWFIATTLFVWRQLKLQKASTDNDHKRFMRESISILNDTLQAESFRNARRVYFRGGPKTPYAELNTKQKGAARAVLSTYGMLGRMVEHDAIDEALFEGYWRSTFLRDWRGLEPFVTGEREASENPRLFSATEELAKKWKDRDD